MLMRSAWVDGVNCTLTTPSQLALLASPTRAASDFSFAAIERLTTATQLPRPRPLSALSFSAIRGSSGLSIASSASAGLPNLPPTDTIELPR